MERYDVAVIGGGNAGLCAAMTAIESCEKVLLIEKSPAIHRGGNSKYTRDIRCASNGPTESTRYTKEEFMEDLLRVTKHDTDTKLASRTIEESFNIPDWMTKHGVRWQLQLKGTLHLGRTNKFFIGGGKALIDTYYDYAKTHNIQLHYDSSVEGLNFESGTLRSLMIRTGGGEREIEAKSYVIASGGFEANIPWLKQYWGDIASNFIVRGCKYNTGTVLRCLLDNDALQTGVEKEFHAVAVDARSPKFDGGIVTRNDSIPFGIVVNKEGKRFYDEGEDLWPKRYAIWGKLIAEQPGQIGYSIVDSKVTGNFLPPMYEPYKSNSITELAKKIDVNESALSDTVRNYNDHIVSGKYDPSILDNCATTNLSPTKSHWALPLDTPPFYSYPLSPGITFTYLGLKVNEEARVLMKNGYAFKNVFAAGEVMAGNILTRGYLAGFGLTIGTTFGRIAGERAVHYG